MEKKDKDLCMKFIHQSRHGVEKKDLVNIIHLMTKYIKKFATYFEMVMKEYEKNNKIYTYMLTFTIDPKLHDVKDKSLHDKIATYIYGYTVARNPLRADIVKEGTDEDHKHIHFHLGLEVKKTIDFSNSLKYYRKTYGSVDVSSSKYGNIYNNVLKYINKSIPSVELVNIKT